MIFFYHHGKSTATLYNCHNQSSILCSRYQLPYDLRTFLLCDYWNHFIKLVVLINYLFVTATHPVDLIITKERTLRDNFTVTDTNNNVVFTVKSSLVTIVTSHEHRFLCDANGNPILHLRRSVSSLIIWSKIQPLTFNQSLTVLVL